MNPFAPLSRSALAIASPRVAKLKLLLEVLAISPRARISRVSLLGFPRAVDGTCRRAGLPALGLAGVVGVLLIAVVLVDNAFNSLSGGHEVAIFLQLSQ